MTYGVLETLFRCREKKKTEKKKVFFISLSLSLCGFVWFLRNDFCEGKMKGNTGKVIFEFLFLKFLTSYLFIWVILG